jgi:uncharacterized protein (DUF488 family)
VSTIYTIGHSTRTLDELVAALHAHEIATLCDIRAFPMSRRLPHFNRENLEQELPRRHVEYRWMPALGGRRKKLRDDSPNTALRNQSFRNYADYMLTADFQAGAAELVALAREHEEGGRGNVAIMCAERVYFQCHRMLVSDYLVGRGDLVLHIDGAGPAKPHKLLAEARVHDGVVTYPGLFSPRSGERAKET